MYAPVGTQLLPLTGTLPLGVWPETETVASAQNFLLLRGWERNRLFFFFFLVMISFMASIYLI